MSKRPIQTFLSANIGFSFGLFRLLLAFLALGTMHLLGVLEGLGDYSYPLISSSLIARVWWHFTTTVMKASLLSSGIIFGFSACAILFRAALRQRYGDEYRLRKGLPENTYGAILAILFITIGSQYSLDWWTIASKLLWLFFLLAILAIFFLVSRLRTGSFKSLVVIFEGELRKLPKGLILSSALVYLLLGGAYEFGQALSNSILEAQDTQVFLAGSEDESRVGSLIDFSESGIIFFQDGRDTAPIFIPIDQIARIEFGSSM